MAGVESERDLYRSLGVDPSASGVDIARAYRRLARQWHPDVTLTSDAAERFARISTAYRVLSDPTARARYDRQHTGASPGSTPRSRPDHRGNESDRQRHWSSSTTDTRRSATSAFWLGGPGFGRALDTPADHASEDAEAEVEVSLDEAYRGGHRILTVTGSHGTTTVPVTIPSGVVTGQLLRVPVDPDPGNRVTPPVVLQVRLTPPEGYRVEGRTVHLDLPLAPWEAVLGTAVTCGPLPTETVVEVPAGTSTGAVLNVPGRGLPNPTGRAGDLCAHVRIVIPSHPSDVERRLFARLARASAFRPRAVPHEKP